MSFFQSLFGPDINEGVAEAHATAGAVLIDVRTPQEFAAGHIEGAVNIPVSAIDQVARVVEDKATPLFVYCASGARSGSACQALARMGYTTAQNIGGIGRWSGEIVQGGK
ncbi:rhodanese-like domain-containing protein [Slackia piriformis]|nr:rhodanese-like domain-containing protein [Slackia piriformis]